MGAKKLTAAERDEIARLHSKNRSVRDIARQLGRSSSTISEELAKGMWHDDDVHVAVYVAIHAQRLRDERAKHSHEHTVLRYQPLEAYVRAKLQLGWSPEQIAGRLPKDHPLDARMRVS